MAGTCLLGRLCAGPLAKPLELFLELRELGYLPLHLLGPMGYGLGDVSVFRAFLLPPLRLSSNNLR